MASERALLNAGYSVIHAKDGDEGLRAARENIPDLILLDMMLPKLSGLDVLRALKGDVLVKHIPVIVLSGLGKANESKLLTEGAAAFIVKSEKSFQNNSSVLLQAVEGIIGSKSAQPIDPPVPVPVGHPFEVTSHCDLDHSKNQVRTPQWEYEFCGGETDGGESR